MRTCSKCGVSRPETDFAYRYKDRGIRQWHCKPCGRKYGRQHYRNNKPLYKARASKWTKEETERNRQRMWDYLKLHPCVDCGESDPIVLEFDHVRGKKIDAVSNMLLSDHCSWEKTLLEIAKCDVRCANCHRRKTYRERGWLKNQTANSSGSHAVP